MFIDNAEKYELQSVRSQYKHYTSSIEFQNLWGYIHRLVPSVRLEIVFTYKEVSSLVSHDGECPTNHVMFQEELLRCSGYDSIRHMLLDCRVNHKQRTVLFERVAAMTEGRVEITLPLLLGFHKSLPSRELRQITTATGQFVLDIGRHV